MKKIVICLFAVMCLASCSTEKSISDTYSWVKDNCVKTLDKGFYQEYTDTTTNVVYAVSGGRYGGVYCSIKN